MKASRGFSRPCLTASSTARSSDDYIVSRNARTGSFHKLFGLSLPPGTPLISMFVNIIIINLSYTYGVACHLNTSRDAGSVNSLQQ